MCVCVCRCVCVYARVWMCFCVNASFPLLNLLGKDPNVNIFKEALHLCIGLGIQDVSTLLSKFWMSVFVIVFPPSTIMSFTSVQAFTDKVVPLGYSTPRFVHLLDGLRVG